ncbi:hypothetical protein [Mucilaginibacter sp. SP1R1]|nr:hypothetical protein [Mucilaginibacter sp. SP1R1]MBB6151101.1 hypothetical protein [Mucilaginibacter sp. SP1R1]
MPISSSQKFKNHPKNKAGHLRDNERAITDIEVRTITYNGSNFTLG